MFLDPERYLRVVAIDPSLNNLGVCHGYVDLMTKKCIVQDLNTYFNLKLRPDPTKMSAVSMISNVTALSAMVYAEIYRSIEIFNPSFVVTEQPVGNGHGRFINLTSYSHQVASIEAIRRAVYDGINNEDLVLSHDVEIYLPNTIKQTIDANKKGKGVDPKELVTKGLHMAMQAGELEYLHSFNVPELMDEHSNDAVAMLLTKARHLPI